MVTSGSSTSRPRPWLWPAILLTVAVLVIGGVVGGVLVIGSSIFPPSGGTTPEPAVALAFAGFGATTGLEVLSVHEEGFLDELMEFDLRGSPADIDRALEVAHFVKPLTPGLHVQEPHGFDLTRVSQVRSAQDEWRDPSSKNRVYRNVIRGASREKPSVDVAHVTAFTT